jgi:hypothetical protein
VIRGWDTAYQKNTEDLLMLAGVLQSKRFDDPLRTWG